MAICSYCQRKDSEPYKGKCPKCAKDPMQYLCDYIDQVASALPQGGDVELKRAVSELNKEYRSLLNRKSNLQKQVSKLCKELKEALDGRDRPRFHP